MKFAKELEQDLVPEWRIKYLNYKAGKKYVKAVSRAIHRASGTPLVRRSGDFPPRNTPRWDAAGRGAGDRDEVDPLRSSPAPIGRATASQARALTSAVPIRGERRGERQGLAGSPGSDARYGSFVATPPSQSPPSATSAGRAHFELPAPAMRIPSNTSEPPAQRPSYALPVARGRLPVQRSASVAAAVPGLRGAATLPARPSPGAVRRLLSFGNGPLPAAAAAARTQPRLDVDMRALDEVRERECDFFGFLDSELDKVEAFYRLKEEQAGQRLALLREQLHEMRNRRTVEVEDYRDRKKRGSAKPAENGGTGNDGAKNDGEDKDRPPLAWIDPIRARLFRPGPNSKALQKMPQTPHLAGGARGDANARRDYVRRPRDQDAVPYKTAKRKLKLALQELYRGLELLKAYALLNRTAFRKLNKKYDKAVGARPPYRYMNEKVSRSWFVTSTVLDGHIAAVEDLYARYFERGNHKIAASKLRNLVRRRQDESPSAFRNGLLIGVGLVLAFQGLVQGAERLFSDDPAVRQQASYLLQIYGGYFLMLYLFILFCLDCRIWSDNKINYPFIFEFDPRSHLDWRQLAQFPSFFLMLFGLFIWLNFSGQGAPEMYLYYPVALIAITVLILFFPFPTLWHRSRKWFIYSHWRLLLSGLYPVEFRDFFLGDIYCSLTYSLCNVELFFCIYANYWENPVQCNSNHSRLLGFFSALPAIWRALQCIRRYHDTENVFPHLVNCGKYTMTILSAVFLSLYRIQGTHSNLALFIGFSTINAVYCSIWDLFMDFSLLQTGSSKFLLRDILSLKQRWPYYVALVADPVLRFAWIFYAIFTYDAQHSTIVSFMVCFAEVTRRGMWTIFRVENEHCANVAQYKASRDTPLPYHLDAFPESASHGFPGLAEEEGAAAGVSTGIDAVSAGGSSRLAPSGTPASTAQPAVAAEDGTPPDMVRRRRVDTLGGKSISALMAAAHKQDFEKKRKPERSSPAVGPTEEDTPSSEEEEDYESRSSVDGRADVREVDDIIERDESGG